MYGDRTRVLPMTRRTAILLVLLVALGANGRALGSGPQSARYADDVDGIFWFMQVSDLHLGTNPSLVDDYSLVNVPWALRTARQVIDPAFIVVTGDLVDGSVTTFPGSGQDQAEWDTYADLYTAAGMTSSFYFDLVGNHDEYSDSCPSLDWYVGNSLQGRSKGAAHFSWRHTTVLGDYFFYALNTTGDCVPLFSAGDGVILASEHEALAAALEADTTAQLRFVFGHHQLTAPLNSAGVIETLAEHSTFYLHGHIHDYREYLQPALTGQVVVNEINPLGWDQTDNIGVGVIDHNAFIYRATGTRVPWPFVIITAPVGVRLRNGSDNPFAYQPCTAKTNPVRALVFADTPPSSVTVQIGTLGPVPMSHVAGALWTAMIDTSSLLPGEHDVIVGATASSVTRAEIVTASFAPGPCTGPLDGGVADTSTLGDGPVDPGAAAGAGAAGPAESPPADGCSCRVSGASSPRLPALMLLGALAVVSRLAMRPRRNAQRGRAAGPRDEFSRTGPSWSRIVVRSHGTRQRRLPLPEDRHHLGVRDDLQVRATKRASHRGRRTELHRQDVQALGRDAHRPGGASGDRDSR
jgi:MYXO-CTERM domain-containing protein